MKERSTGDIISFLETHVTHHHRPRTPGAAGGVGGGSGERGDDTGKSAASDGAERWSAETAPTKMSPRKRLFDAVASLLFGLNYGVFVDGKELKGEQKSALRDLLQVRHSRRVASLQTAKPRLASPRRAPRRRARACSPYHPATLTTD